MHELRRLRSASTGAAVIAGLSAVALIAPPAAATSDPYAPKVSLRVDTNRDGTVDVDGGSDEPGKNEATAARGALFLPNLDDDSERCPKSGPEAVLEKCDDAQDDVVNGADDEADLTPIRLKPVEDIGAQAGGTVQVTPATAPVRLFVRQGESWQGWKAVGPATRFSAGQLKQGLELAIEGKDIARDLSVWDGTVKVKVTVTDSGRSASDTVTLSVAPLLTHHHGQRAQQLFVSPGSRPRDQQTIRDFTQGAKEAAMPKPVHVFTARDERAEDEWTQDYFEAMYASVPGPGGKQRQLQILTRSDQTRPIQETLYTLRGKDVGVVRLGAGKGGTRSSFGNLETIPPHSGYPAGRVVIGSSTDEKASAATLKMLAAQKVQNPLELDTGWLLVGHVDEFLQFLPANTPRGWRIAVADPRGAVELMREAKAKGHGGVAFSPKGQDFRSIDAFLADRETMADMERSAARIDGNIATLKRETGVSDAEIIRVPVFFRAMAEETPGAEPGVTAKEGLKRRLAAMPEDERAKYRDMPVAKAAAALQTEQKQVGALLPDAVNSVVAGPDRIIAATQWGPVIGGKDIVAERVTAAYAKAGMKVTYMDDFDTYHSGGGEVHCGSNTIREMLTKWWNPRS